MKRPIWLAQLLRPLFVVVLLLVVLGVSALLVAASPPKARQVRHAVPTPGRQVQVPTQAAASGGATSWYFAEGYTGSNYTEFLTLADFTTTAAHVTVTYYFSSGAPLTKSYTVPATARLTLDINTEAGANLNVAMAVSADQPIVAERPMYFTANGIPGGTDVLGATQLGQSFTFPYLDTSASHDDWLAVLNPSTSSMTVSIQYFPSSGGVPITATHTVAATSRGTVHINSESGLAAGSYYWAQVSLSTAGLVERTLYLQDTSTGYTGGSTVVGLTQAQTSWFFAEGFTSSTYSERYLLVNPSLTTETIATLTFDEGNGSTVTTQAALAPGTLQLVNVDAVLGLGVNNGAQVQASGAIFAERLISFTYTGAVGGSNSSSIPGFTEVPGTPSAGPLFSFAEGYTGTGYAEWLSILNPDPSTTAAVTVTLVPAGGGTPTITTYQVSPHSRFSLFVNSVLANQSFGMQVTSSTVNVVAERILYFTYGSAQTGGTAVIGSQS